MPSPHSTTRQHRGSSHKIADENKLVPGDWDAISIFRRKYKIPALKIDQSRWDKRWEKTLRTLSASRDVFPILVTHWLGDKHTGSPALFAGMSDFLHKRVCRFRQGLLQFEEALEESGTFVTTWLLLGEVERKRHLFNGIRETCEYVSLHYDGRALCPEITTTAMLKQNGKAFTDFARDFVKTSRELGPDEVYLAPSEWWSSAINMDKPWPEDVQFAFTQLSLQRNEFISIFIASTVKSILHDMSVGSPSMDKVTDLIKTDGRVAFTWAGALSRQRDKPLIRCENCTKAREEIDGNPKFMVCGNCKHELDFVVHYCSRACQKNDWPRHKRHCGKEKITKKLPGTIHDEFWPYPDISDHFRFVSDGQMPITSLGFGTPHPSRPHSPALQRQLALLECDKTVDYYLFDDSDCPIAIVLDERHDEGYPKMAFRMLRSEAMFHAEQSGVEPMVEFLISIVDDRPEFRGVSILAQFEREYGGDMAARMAAFKVRMAEKGLGHGETCLEILCADMRMIVARGFPGLA